MSKYYCIKDRRMIKYYVLAIIWIWLLAWMMFYTKRVKAEMLNPYIDSRNVTPMTELQKEVFTVESEIKKVFGDDFVLARAVFKAESGLNPKAMGWNCWYDKNGKIKKTKTDPTDTSRSCDFKNRDMAWSVDCGVAQLNFPGRLCPLKAMDAVWNIREAYYQKFFPKMNFGAWVAYTNGSYKSHLK